MGAHIHAPLMVECGLIAPPPAMCLRMERARLADSLVRLPTRTNTLPYSAIC